MDKRIIYWRLFLSEDSPQLPHPVLKESIVQSFGQVTPTANNHHGQRSDFDSSPPHLQITPKKSSPENNDTRQNLLYPETCKNAVSILTSSDIVTSIDAYPLKPHLFCLGSLDKYIRLFDLIGDKIVDWYQSTDFITAVAFSPDARLLVVGFSHGLCRVYSMNPNLRYRCAVNCRNSNIKEAKASKVINIKFIGNDEFIVASSDDRVRLFNCSDLRFSKLKYKGHVSSGPILRADCDQYAYIYP